MNLLYGAAGSDGVSANRFRDVVRREYDGESEPLTTDAEQASWIETVADPDGAVLGRAYDAVCRVALAFVGCLNLPAPGWQRGSPMDSPDRAASYLLQRYLELGDGFTSGVIGQYAIAVTDGSRGCVVLASDPTGIRTLFYTIDGTSICYSSNLAVLASACPAISINREMEDFFLCYGYYPWQQTPFAEIRYLEPGAVVRFQDGTLATQAPSHPDPWEGLIGGPDVAFASEERSLDMLYNAFMLATEQQLSSDPKAAVLLGGTDSALVASALRRLGKDVETFSFHYEQSAFNQPHTDTLAKHLGIRHHWIPITEEMLGEGIERYPWAFNFPTNWPNYVIQTQALCRTISDMGFRYVYTGDGCDGTFLGYPRTHVFAAFLAKAWKIDSRATDIATRMLDHRMLEYPAGRLYTLALNSIRSMGRKMPERGYSNFRVMDENSLARLKGASARTIAQSNEDLLRRLAQPLADLSMDRLAYSGKNALSPNRSKLAGSSDSTGLAINSPYLHSGMKRFAMSIPDRLLRPEGARNGYNGKYLLFKMCEVKGLLPRDLIYQKKISAVDAPADQWYLGGLKPMLRKALGDLPFGANERHLEHLLTDRIADRFYRRHVSSDALTSHAVALLATYARFASFARS